MKRKRFEMEGDDAFIHYNPLGYLLAVSRRLLRLDWFALSEKHVKMFLAC